MPQRLPHPLQIVGTSVTGASAEAWAHFLKSRRSGVKERIPAPAAAVFKKFRLVIFKSFILLGLTTFYPFLNSPQPPLVKGGWGVKKLPHHRISSLNPSCDKGIHRYCILVSQIVQGLGSKCSTSSRFAVDVNFSILIRKNIPDIERDFSSRDTDRSRKMSSCIFVRIPYIEIHSLLLLVNGGLHVLNGDQFDSCLCLRYPLFDHGAFPSTGLRLLLSQCQADHRKNKYERQHPNEHSLLHHFSPPFLTHSAKRIAQSVFFKSDSTF